MSRCFPALPASLVRRKSVASDCPGYRFWRCSFVGTLLLGLTLASCPLSATPSLRIAEGSPHASIWRKAYAALPAAWRSDRPLIVQEVSDEEMDHITSKAEEDERRNGEDSRDTDQSRDEDSIVDGCYQDGEREGDPPTITLRERMDADESAMVFTHEYGHHVWDTLLTDAQRSRYTRLWRSARRAHRLVTRYAAESDEEGFAEAFSHFLRKPDLLRRADRSGYDFLRDLLSDMQREREIR